MAIFLSGCAADPTDRATGIAEAEELYRVAYAKLDVALLDRLLAEDFEADYPDLGIEKSRDQFLTEVNSFGALMGEMEMNVDSLNVEGSNTTGLRRFVWKMENEEMGYRERFTHRWRYADGRWQLFAATIHQIENS